jgi:glycine hydroxymethyltransferase
MNPIEQLSIEEQQYQSKSINLIASENYPSTKVLKLQGSVWNNKYGEGYPGKRYYAGNSNTDKLELNVMKSCLEVFNCTDNYSVNVQALSGSPANSIVYLACLEPQDIIMSMDLANGGHLSHLHTTSNWNKFFKHITYNINSELEIDVVDFENKLITNKVKLVIIGFSSYPKKFDFKPLIKLAHKYGALVLCDIAHISGLVATGYHSSPFDGEEDETSDFVTTTTHKTFRGPRGALIFAKKNIPTYSNLITAPIELINKTVFPGTSGGPHFSTIASIGQACYEILGIDNYDDNTPFKTYISNVINNVKALEDGLIQAGIKVVVRSDNHLTLIQLPSEIDSLVIQKKLEQFGIITNRNLIPFDTKSAWKPSGIRLGSAAMTSRGMSSKDFRILGGFIGQIINNTIDIKEFELFKDSLFDYINNPSYFNSTRG